MERIHISQIQAVVEGNNAPLAELPVVTPTETDKKIAEHVLMHLKDGDLHSVGHRWDAERPGQNDQPVRLKGLGRLDGNAGRCLSRYVERGRHDRDEEKFRSGKDQLHVRSGWKAALRLD